MKAACFKGLAFEVKFVTSHLENACQSFQTSSINSRDKAKYFLLLCEQRANDFDASLRVGQTEMSRVKRFLVKFVFQSEKRRTFIAANHIKKHKKRRSR